MNDIDHKIQEALRENAAGANVQDPSITQEMLGTLRGRNRWLSLAMLSVQVLLFAGFVWSAVRLFDTDEVAEQLRWGAMGLIFLMASSFIKLWFWLDLHTNRVLRELKRIELLVLSKR